MVFPNMVTKKLLLPSINRGQSLIWPILLIALTLSATLLFFFDTEPAIGLTNNEFNAPIGSVSADSEIVKRDNKKNGKTPCFLDHSSWQSIEQQMQLLDDIEHHPFVLDQVQHKIEQGCKPNNEFQSALSHFLTHQGDSIEEINQRLSDDYKITINDDIVHNELQQQYYEEYQQQKAALPQWVEDNKQPHETYDQVYARELLKLQQEIYNR